MAKNYLFGKSYYPDAVFEYQLLEDTMACVLYALDKDLIIRDEIVPELHFLVCKAEDRFIRIRAPYAGSHFFLLQISIHPGLSHQFIKEIIHPELILLLCEIFRYPLYQRIPESWMMTHFNLLISLTLYRKSSAFQDIVLWREAISVFDACESIKKEAGFIPDADSFLKTHSTVLERRRFQRVFRLLYGVYLKDMLYSLKMKKAMELILYSTFSLRVIGSMTGFRKPGNFITAFRHHFDSTPFSIRKSLKSA